MGVRLLAAGPARIASEDAAAAGGGGDGPLALDLDAGEGGSTAGQAVTQSRHVRAPGCSASSARNRQSNGTRARFSRLCARHSACLLANVSLPAWECG